MKIVASKIIVVEVLLYGLIEEQLVIYFITVLYVPKQRRDTLNLNNCKWVQDMWKFVGMGVSAGERPCTLKKKSFENIYQPNTWGDIRMLIGIFGLYSPFLPLYDLEIRLWR